MTQFEYLSVLVSIILALGMSEVMISWARMIQRRDHVKFSLLHAFWTVHPLRPGRQASLCRQRHVDLSACRRGQGKHRAKNDDPVGVTRRMNPF